MLGAGLPWLPPVLLPGEAHTLPLLLRALPAFTLQIKALLFHHQPLPAAQHSAPSPLTPSSHHRHLAGRGLSLCVCVLSFQIYQEQIYSYLSGVPLPAEEPPEGVTDQALPQLFSWVCV